MDLEEPIISSPIIEGSHPPPSAKEGEVSTDVLEEESEHSSVKTHPKKPGLKPNIQKREELTNQEKELEKQKTMDEMMKRETKNLRNQGSLVSSKGGISKPHSK